MNQPLAPIETRVHQSLARNGIEGIKVTHLGKGVVKLDFGGLSLDSKPIAIAVARTVTGVTSVTT